MRSFAVIGCILGVAAIGAMNLQSVVIVNLEFSVASHQLPILVLALFILYISHILQVNLDMTDHCTTDFAYDGPIFLVLLSPSYPSSPVLQIASPNCLDCSNCGLGR